MAARANLEYTDDWLKLPRTIGAARRQNLKKFYDPKWRCKNGHDSPRNVRRGGGCWVCDVLCKRRNNDNRQDVGDPTQKKKQGQKMAYDEQSHWPWKPKASRPERVDVNLKIDDDRRNHGCTWYMWCLAFSWRGFQHSGASWICSDKCPYNKPCETSAVPHRLIPYLSATYVMTDSGIKTTINRPINAVNNMGRPSRYKKRNKIKQSYTRADPFNNKYKRNDR